MKISTVPVLDDSNLFNWLRQLNISLRNIPAREATPASTNAPGSKGEWAYDNAFIYICVADNTWGRIPLDMAF